MHVSGLLEADLVSFSGDKLLGGPQAGILAGKPEMVARLRRNPLFRALRVDKMIYQALENTLRHLLLERWEGIPALAMIRQSPEEIRARRGVAGARAGNSRGDRSGEFRDWGRSHTRTADSYLVNRGRVRERGRCRTGFADGRPAGGGAD